jgi:hypothetical protein
MSADLSALAGYSPEQIAAALEAQIGPNPGYYVGGYMAG